MSARKKATTKQIQCKYFTWLVYKRKGVYQADGRSNQPSVGRHSLETRLESKVRESLDRLDLVQAVKHGLASESALNQSETQVLLFEEGEELYRKHCHRPAVVGGPTPATWKRYRPVLKKAITHFQELGLTTWNQVTKREFDSYAGWLDGEGYAYATEVTELTTLQQTMNYFIASKLLPADCKIELPLKKPTESDTYCYTVEEYLAMVLKCEANPNLKWLGEVIVALATTGMRISELASLNWVNVDLNKNVIALKDERRSRIALRRKARTTKNSKGRSFPIHPDLRRLLDRKADRGTQGNVFSAQKGGKLLARNVLQALIDHVIEPLSDQFPSPEEEIGFKDGRLHSFRHFFCSECANSNIPEQVVKQWLGHQSSAMVRRYYHLKDDESQRQIKKLDFRL